MTAERPLREVLLEQSAIATARDWTQSSRLELAREGRRADGGWPGTLSEARARAGEDYKRLLAKRSLKAPVHEELELVAKLTTEEARRAWRSIATEKTP